MPAAGHSNPEIAARLYISNETVKTHVSSLLSKIDARTAPRPSSPPTSPDSCNLVHHDRWRPPVIHWMRTGTDCKNPTVRAAWISVSNLAGNPERTR